MQIEFAVCSSQGRRPSNEDAVLAEPQLGVFAVADGMGGYEGGEVASRTVVASLERFFRRNAADPEATWPGARDRARSLGEDLLANGVLAAHGAVCTRKVGRLANMGSTVAAIVVDGREVVVGHVGDSRVYRLRGGALTQLTRDHSLYAELEAAGAQQLGPRDRFPYANVITRALGMPGAEPDLRSEPARAGDTYLLCTDGLFDGLPEAAIAALLAEPGPLEDVCRALVEGAIAGGSRDNVSAVVVRLA